MARYFEVLCFMLEKLGVWLMESAKLHMLQNERLESFWDALWLRIRRFLCFMLEKLCVSLMESAKLNMLPNERLESF